MKKTLFLFFALATSIFFVSCKTSSPTAPIVSDTGTPTAVGTPIGSPSTATIDATGGTVKSPDGRLEVIIPANALSVATSISIQPITNQAPLGAGVGFDLSPSGQKFNIPITLRFHYDDSDRAGTDIKALAVATQKDDHIWYSFNTTNLDEAAGTLSISTKHFSTYSLYESLRLIPYHSEIARNATELLAVVFVPKAKT